MLATLLLLLQDFSDKESGFSLTLPDKSWQCVKKDKALVAFTNKTLQGHVVRELYSGTLTAYNSEQVASHELEWTKKAKVSDRPAFHNRLTRFEMICVDAGDGVFFRIVLENFDADTARKLVEGTSISAPQYPSFESKKWKVRFKLPVGWKGEELEKPEGIIVARFSGEEGAGGCGIEDFAMSLEDHFDWMIEALKEKGYKVVLHSEKSDKHSFSASYTLTRGTDAFRYRMRLASDGDKIYRLYFYCDESEAKLYQTHFEKLSESFAIVK